MDSSELKLKIFREIDSLDSGKLQEVYGYIQNFLRGEKDLNDWEKLSTTQKEGIYNSIRDLDAGKGIANDEVISKYRKKYPNA